MTDYPNEINTEKSYNRILTTEINSNLASEKSLIAVNHTPYEFKDEPIQLVISSDGILETTTEAINILTALKNEKLCILSFNGPLSTGKSTLANLVINKESQGFKVGEKTQGIWLWGKPITLDGGIKLLILDCQGLEKSENDKTSFNLFLLMMYYLKKI